VVFGSSCGEMLDIVPNVIHVMYTLMLNVLYVVRMCAVELDGVRSMSLGVWLKFGVEWYVADQ